ncbi:hypothetical protein SAMN05216188_117110 [Lentzea xinjiangensis]|uniref:REase associating with pPIWI RE domain-containing protein n=1 Tax=Lentzea xinjiangensis TaxID=402600 RepID=A0A1H9T252_9PSEU|nr:hypothetical protein [Lentzea xinjiangensis]SER91342.1 hypothetical protein SAMN05216188_117110 [Lentzea xinjiangensis]
MTITSLTSRGDVLRRQDRVVAASLRAAHVRSETDGSRRTMREICRMTGVIMEALGPGRAPASPYALIEALHRPLRHLLSFVPNLDDHLGAVQLLSDDRLTDHAYDIAVEFAGLLGRLTGPGELPSWARARADQTQHEAFGALKESGDQKTYVRARKFVIEFPAGKDDELRKALRTTGARCRVEYTDLSVDQKYPSGGDEFWWGCPVCRYPMAVTGKNVRCRYRPHRALYQVAGGRGTPRLLVKNGEEKVPPAPEALPASGVRCVDSGVWRFIVVPGATELRLAKVLETASRQEVSLWPQLDSYDLLVTIAGKPFGFDVKEYRSIDRLLTDLAEKPPRATVLLPRTHEHQEQPVLDARLPGVRVTTESKLLRRVRRAVREAS